MLNQESTKRESRLDRTDRIARELIAAERRAEEIKTARLRKLRLAREETTA